MNKKFISVILAALLMVSTAAIAASAEEVAVETSGDATGTIKFDPGDWDSKKILFYIWDDTAGLKATKDGWVSEDTWGSKTKIGGTKLDDGTFESYEVTIPEGHDVFVIFHDPARAQTFDCVLTPDAIGDTARLTGEILENPVDSEQRASAVRFDNSGLTSKLCITSSGKVQGETITPTMDVAYDVAKFIFKYQGTNEKITGDPVVTEATVNNAISAFGTDAASVWEKYQGIKGSGTELESENGGYTDEKEAEAKKLLGIEDEKKEEENKDNTSSKTNDADDNTSSTTSTASNSTTNNSTTTNNSANKTSTTTATTTTTTATTGTTTDGAATDTGDTTGTAAFAAIFLGAAAVMFAARKKVED